MSKSKYTPEERDAFTEQNFAKLTPKQRKVIEDIAREARESIIALSKSPAIKGQTNHLVKYHKECVGIADGYAKEIMHELSRIMATRKDANDTVLVATLREAVMAKVQDPTRIASLNALVGAEAMKSRGRIWDGGVGAKKAEELFRESTVQNGLGKELENATRSAKTKTAKIRLKAATVVQSIVRGHQAKKALDAKKKVATALQPLVRGHQARKALDAKKKAATTIQSLVRGHQARKAVNKTVTAKLEHERAEMANAVAQKTTAGLGKKGTLYGSYEQERLGAADAVADRILVELKSFKGDAATMKILRRHLEKELNKGYVTQRVQEWLDDNSVSGMRGVGREQTRHRLVNNGTSFTDPIALAVKKAKEATVKEVEIEHRVGGGMLAGLKGVSGAAQALKSALAGSRAASPGGSVSPKHSRSQAHSR